MDTPTATNTKSISSLSELGRTFIYRDTPVVPSQSYAQFSGKEVKRVNEGLRRVAGTGRLVEGEDFFCLSYEQANEFTKVARGVLPSNHGITLLTRKAINTLSHFFDDPNSVGLSDTVNTIATRAMERSTTQDLIICQLHAMLAIREKQLEHESAIALLEGTSADHDRHFLDLAVSSDREKNKRLMDAIEACAVRSGSKVVCGYIKNVLKERFGQKASTRRLEDQVKISQHPTALDFLAGYIVPPDIVAAICSVRKRRPTGHKKGSRSRTKRPATDGGISSTKSIITRIR